MKLAHVADLHLGFRQYQRQGSGGVNQRELDVAQAFARAVDAIVAAQPDLIVVAGDVFHVPRPTPGVLLHALREFRRLAQVAPTLVVAGNHDTPRATENGYILPLLETVGCRVIPLVPRRERVGDCAVWCVPDTGVPQPVTYQPDTSARFNVALVHGEVRGLIPGAPDRPQDIDPAVWANGWDYVALGHYHVQHQVAPKVWYAGATEYTSSNPWAEIGGAPKGWLLVDLTTGVITPQPIPGVRRYVDLPPFSAAGEEPEAVLAAIAAQIGSVTDASETIVRQVVRHCEPSTRRALNQVGLRQLRRKAWQVQLIFPKIDPTLGANVRVGINRRSVADQLTEHATRRAEAAALDVDQTVAAAHRYLATATEALAPSDPVAA